MRGENPAFVSCKHRRSTYAPLGSPGTGCEEPARVTTQPRRAFPGGSGVSTALAEPSLPMAVSERSNLPSDPRAGRHRRRNAIVQTDLFPGRDQEATEPRYPRQLAKRRPKENRAPTANAKTPPG